MDDTKATATDTSEGDGKNSDKGMAAGAATQTAKTEDADRRFTQADQDSLAAKVRAEEKAKFERQQERVKREAEEAKAKEQGEFQKLAEGYKRELDEVKPLAEQLDTYKEAVQKLARQELKSLPEEVQDIAPPIDNPLEVLAWLPKGKKLAERLSGGPVKRGNGGDPQPTGTSTVFDKAREDGKRSQESQSARGPGWLSEKFKRPASQT